MSRLVASLPSAHTIDAERAQDHVDHYFDQFSTENTPLGRKLRTLLVKWMRLMADTDREGRDVLRDGLIETHDVELNRQIADHIADRVWDAMTLVRNRMGDIAAEHGAEPTFDDLAQAIETLGAEATKAERNGIREESAYSVR